MNASLQALASTNSGATAPSTTYANMLWYDTAANILKMRSEADDAWINVAYVDQSSNAWRVLDDTQVVNTSGTQTGLLGDQTTATWESGVSTVESLVSPVKVRSAISNRVVGGGISSVSRSFGTAYQNTRGRDIIVMPLISSTLDAALSLEISSNGSSWFPAFRQTVSTPNQVAYALCVPVGFYYRVTTSAGTGVVNAWREIF
jgi:hypothetical protein